MAGDTVLIKLAWCTLSSTRGVTHQNPLFWRNKIKKAEDVAQHNGQLLLFLREVWNRDRSRPFHRTEVLVSFVDRQEGAASMRLPLVADVRECTIQRGDDLGQIHPEVSKPDYPKMTWPAKGAQTAELRKLKKKY